MSNYIKAQELCKAFEIKTPDFLSMLVEHEAVRKDEDIDGYVPTRLGKYELGLRMKFNEEYQRASVLFDIDNKKLVKYIDAFKSKEAIYQNQSLVEYLKSSGVNLDSKRVKVKGVSYLQSSDEVLLHVLENMGLLVIDDESGDYHVKDVAADKWGIYKNSDTETKEIWIKFKDKSFSRLFKDVYASKTKSHDIAKIDSVFRKHFLNELNDTCKQFVNENKYNCLYIYKLLCSRGIITRAYVDSHLVFRKEKDAKEKFGGCIDSDGLRFDYRIYQELILALGDVTK